MKNSAKALNRMVVLVAGIAVVCCTRSEAAVITWQTPDAPFTSAAQVANTGTRHVAVNINDVTDVTINGVLFDGSSTESNGSTALSGPNYSLTSGAARRGSDVYTASGDADLNELMDSFIASGADLTVSGLTPGNDYRIQLFASDDRASGGGGTGSWSDEFANASVPFANPPSGSVIGTFTADAASQLFDGAFPSGNPTRLNAFALFDVTSSGSVPEPSSAVLLLIAGLAYRRRFHRKRSR